MRRQLRVSLTLLAVALVVAVFIHPQTADAKPAAVTVAAVAPVKNFEATVVQNGKTIAVLTDTDVSGDVYDNGAPTTVQTVNYPAVGPVHPWRWQKLRYNPNTGAYHPSVCVDPWETGTYSGVGDSWPIKPVTGAWNQDQFFLWYSASGNEGCSILHWPNHARIDVHFGSRTDTCTHGYVNVDDDYKVTRSILYIDHWNGNCWGDAETVIWRVSRGLGNMIGLKNHDGDGSPSVHATKVYIWPTWYDDHTVGWFN